MNFEKEICPICRLECKPFELIIIATIEGKADMNPKIPIDCGRCGKYKIDSKLYHATKDSPSILSRLGNNYKGKEYILSGVTRNASERRNSIEITYENIAYLIDSAPNPNTPLEVLDRILVYVAEKAKDFKSYVEINPLYDYPLFYARSYDDLSYVLSIHERIQYLENDNKRYRLTPEGWKRADQLIRKNPDSKKVFIAMWYDKEKKYIKTCEEAFIPALKETDFEPTIMVFLEHNEKIDDQIMAEIKGSKFLIADLTGSRGSVLWEAGFAMGLGIKVIWTCHKDWLDEEKIPFTIRQFNYIDWKEHDDLKKRLINRIKVTIL
jgi:hypothetical protein